MSKPGEKVLDFQTWKQENERKQKKQQIKSNSEPPLEKKTSTSSEIVKTDTTITKSTIQPEFIEIKPKIFEGKSLLKDEDKLAKENDEGNIEYKWKLVNLTPERFKHLVSQMNFRLSEGQGEALYEIGVNDNGVTLGLTDDEYKETLENITKMATELKADVSIICEKMIESKKKDEKPKRCAELLVRLFEEGKYLDLRVAVCGNVDSGKSTFIGVLTKGRLDNGRGLARTNVFQHKHEVTTGRTSSISHQIIGFDSKGKILNYHENELGTPTWKEIIDKSAKVITFIDLAGHEKYLKTTVYGMTGSIPDYALIVVGSNMGVTRMTKEHIGLALALKIPMIFIVTKIDICPENVLKETLDSINKILKLPGVRKLPYMIKTDDDVIQCSKNIVNDRIAPVFMTSHVTGENLDLLKKFLNLLPLRRDWESQMKKPAEFFIDQTFFVTGVGTVVSGVVTQGMIHVGDVLTLGPDGNGQWKRIGIKGIHCKRNQVKTAYAGQHASLALKKEKRSNIRKGMVLLADEHPKAVWEFTAEVLVLYHSTTISTNYQPVIHCMCVRQCAKIVSMDEKESLRTGDKSKVRFRFMFRPEYIRIGERLIFREGRTKGLGVVTEINMTCDKEEKK